MGTGISILSVRFPRFDVEIPKREYAPSLDKNPLQFDKAKKSHRNSQEKKN
jgi:hypothetical protein